MLDFFLGSPWPGMVVWTLLYISDYALTIWCASLYQKHVRGTIAFDGSYELTPVFQRDVDALKMVSARFLVALASSLAAVGLVWLLASTRFLLLYAFLLGAMLLVELTVHVRHVRNLAMFLDVAKGGVIRGRIEYSRPAMLRMSAVELAAFAGVYFIIFLFTESWFVLGGAASCLSTARKHFILARKATCPAPSAYPAVFTHF
jgi:hypothetical protein